MRALGISLGIAALVGAPIFVLLVLRWGNVRHG